MDHLHLQLKAVHLHKPEDRAAAEFFTVRVTPEHTIGHVEHSLWLFSEDNWLKPVFLRILHNGERVASSTRLADLGIVADAPAGSHHLVAEIDYTLFGHPSIPARDAYPDLFDVVVTMPPRPGNYFTRELLHLSVASVKELMAAHFRLDSEFSLQFRDSSQTHDIAEDADPDVTFQDLLQLDVPPLKPVHLVAVCHEPATPVRVTSLDGSFDEVLRDVGDGSALALKKAVAAATGQPVACISITRQTPDQVVFDVHPNVVSLDGEPWTATGTTFCEVEHDGRRRTVPALLLSSELYEIEYQDRSVTLATSECIVQPEGYVLMTAMAARRMAASLGLDANTLWNHGLTARRATGSGTLPTPTTTIPEAVPAGVPAASPAGTPGPQDPTAPRDASPLDPTAAREVPAAFRVQPMDPWQIFRNLGRSARAHGMAFFVWAFNFGLTLNLMDDMLWWRFSRKPVWVLFLALAAVILVFFLGTTLSTWIQENLLADTDDRAHGCKVLQYSSRALWVTGHATKGWGRQVGEVGASAVYYFHQPPHSRLLQQLEQPAPAWLARQTALQAVVAVLAFTLSTVPFVGLELMARAHLQTAADTAELRRLLAANVSALKARGLDPRDVVGGSALDEAADIEHTLKAFLVSSWVLRRGLDAELPPRLRAQ